MQNKYIGWVIGDKSIKDLQKRWKYHRDCYIRAKRKLKEYVPSGSAATSSANIKCSYKFYELMRPLDDALETKSTVSSLSDKDEESLNQENYVASTFAPTQQSSQPSSTLFNTENTNYSNVESSNRETIEILTPMASPASETLMPTVKTTKRQKTHNQSELETVLLDVLKTPIPEMDAVDGFLKMLGESLRRLPYRRRAIMEIKIFEMVLEAESKETE
ncbi:hypothetical protein RF55_16685 [Lasius niger]|uniref:BESS domain-containing protein n=1 Tax=Lasius niger TaxID=67767 RepID=A0A0J7MX88_LASNI|nr:hypothetical protein RF55_16685 [Lasius niger]